MLTACQTFRGALNNKLSNINSIALLKELNRKTMLRSQLSAVQEIICGHVKFQLKLKSELSLSFSTFLKKPQGPDKGFLKLCNLNFLISKGRIDVFSSDTYQNRNMPDSNVTIKISSFFNLKNCNLQNSTLLKMKNNDIVPTVSQITREPLRI